MQGMVRRVVARPRLSSSTASLARRMGLGAGEGSAMVDDELAGMLGMLGIDAYTHDQLVAKDEGEEASYHVCTLVSA